MSPRVLALLGIVVVAGVAGGASAIGPANKPGASAQAWAIRVTSGSGTASVTAPPNSGAAYSGGFAYPADGSVITTGATTASATTTIGNTNAVAKASAEISSISIFGGEITADAIVARAAAGAQPAGAAGDFDGTSIVNLNALGQSATSGRIALGDWGYAIVNAQGVDTAAPAGAHGHRAYVTALIVHLNVDHGGLGAGSEIQIGYAEAAAQTPPPPAPTTTTTTGAKPTPQPKPSEEPERERALGDRPQTRSDGQEKSVFRAPPTLTPKLTGRRYVFPVYGPSSYSDTWGAPRAVVGWHHGTDIFGQLGQPLLAVADGTVFSVGWNDIGGNRLWLRDSQGNEFYYAHLSAFSTLAVNGAHVKAGQVVGFMGRTGDAEGTPYHLHFEVHPVSRLYLGYDGAVNAYPYLQAWERLEDLPFPIATGWAPAIGRGSHLPPPGAILLGMSDISSADGLDPQSLRRALAPPKTDGLPPPGVPTTVPPTGDLGRA